MGVSVAFNHSVAFRAKLDSSVQGELFFFNELFTKNVPEVLKMSDYILREQIGDYSRKALPSLCS